MRLLSAYGARPTMVALIGLSLTACASCPDRIRPAEPAACLPPPTLEPRAIPEPGGTTYRDALIHRVRLVEFAQQCESDKATARAALPTDATRAGGQRERD